MIFGGEAQLRQPLPLLGYHQEMRGRLRAWTRPPLSFSAPMYAAQAWRSTFRHALVLSKHWLVMVQTWGLISCKARHEGVHKLGSKDLRADIFEDEAVLVLIHAGSWDISG